MPPNARGCADRDDRARPMSRCNSVPGDLDERPAVPALDAPEVDAERDRDGDHRRERAGRERAVAHRHDAMDGLHRCDAEQESGKRRRCANSAVSRTSRGSVAGEWKCTTSVTRYGAFGRKTSQIASSGQQQGQRSRSTSGAPDRACAHVRDPGQEQVPDDVAAGEPTACSGRARRAARARPA